MPALNMTTSDVLLHSYKCGDFNLASELILPYGLPGEGEAAWVCFREVPLNLGAGALHGFMAQALPGRFLFQVPGVARFLVCDGKEIHVDPTPGVDPDSLRAFLLSTALAALLLQRGFLVLGGGAATRANQTVALIGATGAGCSTMLAGLQNEGWSLVSDGVCALKADAEGRIAAWPVYPGLALWRDYLDRRGLPWSELPPLRPGLGKYLVPFERVADSPHPLTHVVELRLSNAPYASAAILGGERLVPLLEHASLGHFLGALALREQHLGLAVCLARQAVFHCVNRPHGSNNEAAFLAWIMACLNP